MANRVARRAAISGIFPLLSSARMKEGKTERGMLCKLLALIYYLLLWFWTLIYPGL